MAQMAAEEVEFHLMEAAVAVKSLHRSHLHHRAQRAFVLRPQKKYSLAEVKNCLHPVAVQIPEEYQRPQAPLLEEEPVARHLNYHHRRIIMSSKLVCFVKFSELNPKQFRLRRTYRYSVFRSGKPFHDIGQYNVR
jgi:hypothetical protein